MKTTLSVKGQFEISGDDLLRIMREYVSADPTKLLPIISNYTEAKFGYPTKRLQYDKNNLEKVIAIVDYTIDEGVKTAKVFKPAKQPAKRSPFNRPWTGFYASVREIVDAAKAKKKTSMTFDDLYDELTHLEDDKGNRKFIRDGVPISPKRVRQYLSKSQTVRQANMRGIFLDRKLNSLKF